MIVSSHLTCARRISTCLFTIAFLLLLLSCQPKAEVQANSVNSLNSVNQAPIKAKANAWVFIGDSLTAGFGLGIDQSFVARLDEQFQREGIPWTLRNAGVSGDTSAGVLRRLDWLIDDQVKRAFICIGANDGLRGQSVDALYDNLNQIIHRLKAQKVEIILAGIKMPMNYGEEYRKRFEEVYQRVAQEQQIPLLPFLLEGVAADPSLNLEDGIHPNAKGQEKIAAHVYQFLKAQGLIHQASSK